MSDSKGIKNYLPYIVGILVMVLIPLIYMSPVFEGKQISQFDILQYEGASSEVREYREQNGEEALWNSRMFGGMPSFITGIHHKSNFILQTVNSLRKAFPYPSDLLIINLLGFYLLLLVLRVNPWLAIGGAAAYGLGTFTLLSIEAGHTSKIIALGFVPAILSGVFMVYIRKKIWLGSALTTLFLSLHIAFNHYQITYYLLFVLLFIGLAHLLSAYRNKNLNSFFKESSFLIIAGLIAIGPNISKLWTTYEYSKETIRGGKSELTEYNPENSAKSRTGLDWDYAMAWSYGKLETMTLLIPNFVGGNNQMELDKDAHIAKKGIPKQYYEQAPMYWGKLPFTSGPVYIGAALSFLFVLGLFLIKGHMRWWILGFSTMAILLSWGKNFEAFNAFFFNYVPLYNKFRTPSMILLFLSLTFSLAAMLGLQKLMTEEKLNRQEVLKKIYFSLGITGGLVLVFGILLAGTYDYSGPSDARFSQAGWPMDALRADRESMLQSDAFRSLIFILIAAGLVYAYVKNLIKKKLFIAGIVLLLIIDIWPVDRRFFGEESFTAERKLEQRKRATPADNAINQDKSHYRVLNMAANTFNDAVTSFHHNSIGGYHAAKILRYQEVIENHINPSIQSLKQVMGNQPTQAKIDKRLANSSVLNMLNTKYIIYNPEAKPIQNKWALGNAWVVQNINWVSSADDEMESLGSFESGTEVVIRDDYKEYFEIKDFRYDPNASIRLTNYSPNSLTYQSSVDKSASDQIAVFSEIYYEGGNNDWKVFIDGKAEDHYRVNYILRGMLIPKGDHEIKFVFEPRSYYLGSKISLAFSIIVVLFLVFGIWKERQHKPKKS